MVLHGLVRVSWRWLRRLCRSCKGLSSHDWRVRRLSFNLSEREVRGNEYCTDRTSWHEEE